MASKGTPLFTLALELRATGVDDEAVVANLVSEADGSRDALRSAYARALALSAALPDDRQAERLVTLVAVAMRRQWGPHRELTDLTTSAN